MKSFLLDLIPFLAGLLADWLAIRFKRRNW